MGAHQRETAGPVEVDRTPIARAGAVAVRGRLEHVHDLRHRPAGPRGPIQERPSAVAQDQASIGRLAATTRVEDGPVEHDEWAAVALRDLQDARLERPRVRVAIADLVDASASWPGRDQAPTLSVPFMFTWTVQMNG